MLLQISSYQKELKEESLIKGLVINVINQLIGGVRQSMGYIGCRTIEEMQRDSQFVEITNAGMTESHVHDVMITKEAPNYQRS